MKPLKRAPEEASQAWVGLAEAAEYLGIHITTLRRWADAGRVAHIRTPGGKRRFLRRDLGAFQQGLFQAEASGPRPAVELQALDPPRRQLEGEEVLLEPWKLHMSPELQNNFRHSGQLLMALLMQYNCRSDAGESFLAECRQKASQYAGLCRQAGMSLGETVQTFLFFRRSILESIHDTSTIDGQTDPESRRMFQRTNYFLDQFLLELVKGFEK
jgi:excisionase family DNA binding protein